MASRNNDYYIERDISWMYFNRRILQEAMREDVPLLERMSFLGIYSNNLDEFFRVRVATQNRIAECTGKSTMRESERAKKLLKQLVKLNSEYAKDFERAVHQVTKELEAENICIISSDDVTPEQLAFIHDYYKTKLNGFISPVLFSSVKSLDRETDEDIYMAVKMLKVGTASNHDYAFFELPVGVCGRFLQVPDGGVRKCLMYLDDVVRCCLPLVFEGLGYTDFHGYTFKFTRDAEMEIDNDLRAGTTVLESGRYQNHKDLMQLPDCGRKDLKYPAWPSITRRSLDGPESLLQRIQHSDRFIHVPYHNFDSFVRVLQEAAVSKNVRGIKISLYRLAKDSKVVRALMGAARNGKKVTVVIELLARFDEASNINWSKRMQEAGIKVIFGVEGLKVHSKIVHIEMRNGPDIACIGTGNFHEGNARVYTDFLLMTAKRSIVKDVNSVFQFIEYPYTQVKFKELLVSPNEMKTKFVALINNEIKNKKAGKPAYIKVKINHVTDPVIIKKLYEASAAGVDIDLLVRGNCSLMPGIPGVSSNIRISGIIDRYLEHSRIYIFAAGGEERMFIGSADWMPRNLDNRVEVVAPVYDPALKNELRRIVDYGLNDTSQGRIVDGTGSNRFKPHEGEAFRSQEALYNDYLAENESETEK